MLVLFVLLVLVPPIPVFPLLLALQPVEFAVSFMPLLQPVPVSTVFAVIPVMVVMVVGIIDPAVISISIMLFVLLNCDRRFSIRQR